MEEQINQPEGELVLRTLALPCETNPNGDIFGGWVFSQMDIGGGVIASRISSTGRVVTACVNGMSFIYPVKVGDLVSCYAKPIKIGRTSMQIQLQIWSHNSVSGITKHVTHGVFTYVGIDDNGKSTPLKYTEATLPTRLIELLD